MVAKVCSRSHGQPEPDVRSAAIISISAAMSREGFTRGNAERSAQVAISDSHKRYYGTFLFWPEDAALSNATAPAAIGWLGLRPMRPACRHRRARHPEADACAVPRNRGRHACW